MSSPHIRRHSQDSGLVLEGKRKQVLDDVLEVRQLFQLMETITKLPQLFCSRPTTEIFQRSWREDAVFEVSIYPSFLHRLRLPRTHSQNAMVRMSSPLASPAADNL